jgi:hypothetical protein
MNRVVLLVGLCCTVGLAAGTMATADSIALRSGNAVMGAPDPQITVCGSPYSFGGTTIPAAPVSLQQAVVIPPDPTWTSLVGSSWVGYAAGIVPSGGYRYSVEFYLTTGFLTPSMTVAFSADNACTVFLNGSIIEPSSPPKGYTAIHEVNTSAASLFQQGPNVLSFDVMNGEWLGDWGGPSGVLFSAEVTYSSAAVPEPASLLLAIGGLGTLLGLRRHMA